MPMPSNLMDATETWSKLPNVPRRRILAGRAGMTFIEIVVVIFILGIVALLGVPHLDTALTKSYRDAAADEVETALKYARFRAVNSSGTYRVTVSATNNTVEVTQFAYPVTVVVADVQAAETDVEDGAYVAVEHPVNRGSDYSIDFDTEFRLGSASVSASVFGADEYVEFNSFGEPSSGGSVTITCGGSDVVISVDAQTGSISRSG